MRHLSLTLFAFTLTAGRVAADNASLASDPSAFIRQHATTAVNWMRWDDAAFARARQEQKPIYLAIGEFTNELGRAMAQQSFSNADVAAFLNEHFVSILVDANERPDLVALYQAYVRTTKQLNGLPLNIWLTPELLPIDGATYLPPTEEWGKEGFFTAIKRIAAAWKADAEAQRHKAQDATEAVAAADAPTGAHAAPDAASRIPALLSDATATLAGSFDAAHPGFGDPPRYLEPELLDFLLRDPPTRDSAVATLRAIIASPVRDPLDGGFFRYAQDADWKQPYFQKTLSDQARIVLALLEAAELTKDDTFSAAARGALDYTLTSLHGRHGFAAAEDATPATLATYYLWTRAEIESALGADAAAFCQAFNITAEGNVPADAYPGVKATGTNLLYRAPASGDATQEKKLDALRAKLLTLRAQRTAPRRDDRATAGAHGLMLAALSRAGAQLHEPRFAAAAKTELAFIQAHLTDADRGLRRLPDTSLDAAPEDYARVIVGLWASSAAGETAAASLATELKKNLDARFWDAGAYFAFPKTDAPGFWARVHAPLAPPHEPSAEATMLISNSTRPLPADYSASLAVTLAAQLEGAADQPRGDILLALRSH